MVGSPVAEHKTPRLRFHRSKRRIRARSGSCSKNKSPRSDRKIRRRLLDSQIQMNVVGRWVGRVGSTPVKHKIGLVHSQVEKTFKPSKHDENSKTALGHDLAGSRPLRPLPEDLRISRELPGQLSSESKQNSFVRVPSDPFADDNLLEQFVEKYPSRRSSSKFDHGPDGVGEFSLLADSAIPSRIKPTSPSWDSDSGNDGFENSEEFFPFEFEETRPMNNIRNFYPSNCMGWTAKNAADELLDATPSSLLMEQFELREIIGVGAFGVVFKAIHKLDGQEYAIKAIPFSGDIADQEQYLEVRHLSKASWHTNVIRYFGSWVEPLSDALKMKLFKKLCRDSSNSGEGSNTSYGSNSTDLCSRLERSHSVILLQMELCHYNLREWLTDRKTVDRKASLQIFRGIVSGIAHFHSMGMMHRDLKPANIFLVDEGGEVPVPKIGDFGLACDHPCPGYPQQMTKGLGTPSYSSPEQRTSCYNEAVDVYPLGLILFEMLWRLETAHQRVKAFYELKKGVAQVNFNKQFPRVADIIGHLLSKKAESRPTAETLLQRIDTVLAKLLQPKATARLKNLVVDRFDRIDSMLPKHIPPNVVAELRRLKEDLLLNHDLELHQEELIRQLSSATNPIE